MTCFMSLKIKKHYESKIANALDNLEVQLQHNHTDFSTWEEIEYDKCYMMDKNVLLDETLFGLKRQFEGEAEHKMRLGGIDRDLVRQRVAL
jgi:putative hydrolase of HD superfamily